MDWFRSWHGAPTDPKWLVVARKAAVAPGVVSAVVWALFDHASQNAENRGSVADFDVETYAAFSGFEEEQVRAIIRALTDKGLIVDGCLTNWKKRQPAKEDTTATERKRRQRDNEVKAEASRLVTPRHAKSREVTTDKRREDTEEKREVSVGAVADATPATVALKIAENLACAPRIFEEFWKVYPKRQGANPREPAKKALTIALRSVAPEAIIGGAERYADELRKTGKLETQFVARAVTWIEERRWQDYPVAESTTGNLRPRGIFVALDTEPWRAWSDHYRANGGPNGLKVAPRSARCGPNSEEGWHFPAEWPPGHSRGLEVSSAA